MVNNINPKQLRASVIGRSVKVCTRELFLHNKRAYSCLGQDAHDDIQVNRLDLGKIRSALIHDCETIEHQFIMLRDLTLITHEDFKKRHQFIKKFLDCILSHHDKFYQGVMYGSSVNGLGFRDSDVDLRLRCIDGLSSGELEVKNLDADMIHKVLSDIAYQTTNCCVCSGCFIPSSRCPIAKLQFFVMDSWKTKFNFDPLKAIQGLSCDVSISSNPLGAYNSLFIRSLCIIEPKFHLLATAVRFWALERNLIQPGLMSSYALINMIIFFCQNIDEPLLPTVDEMRDRFVKSNPDLHQKGIVRAEWVRLISRNPSAYARSSNNDTLALLLLKFFEFYLKFPYSTQIITIRLGRALSRKEYATSAQYHPRFPIKPFINIQDPFDLPHNLTSGMSGAYFHQFITAVRLSYEKMFKELLNHFSNPYHNPKRKKSKLMRWGLASVFESTEGGKAKKSK